MSYTKYEVVIAASNAESLAGCLRNLDRTVSGSSVKYLRKFIQNNNIDISHFRDNWRILKGKCPKKSAQDILIYDKHLKYRQNHKLLKRALIEIGREYRCESCGINEWFGNKDILQIDHIKKDLKDNRPENLRFLCPNCHVNTDTYGNKKEKQQILKERPRKVEWPTKENLENLVWSIPTTKIAQKYGVSDKAVSKWCEIYNISKPPRGYWTKKAA